MPPEPAATADAPERTWWKIALGAGISTALQAGFLWTEYPREVAIVSMAMALVLTGAHPALVAIRGWERALWPPSRHGLFILISGCLSTVVLAALLAVYCRTTGGMAAAAALLAAVVSAASILTASGAASRQGGGDYQLRNTALVEWIADAVQNAADVVASDAAATRFVQKLFGVPGQRQALFGFLIAFLIVVNGLGGAFEDRPSVAGQREDASAQDARTETLPAQRPSNTNPDQMLKGVSTTVPPAMPTATEVCGGDPREVLRALFGKENQAAAENAVAALAFLGLDTTGCPGPKPFTVGNFTVLPLKAPAIGRASYVAIDQLGKATVIEPAGFEMFGEPDADGTRFRSGALTDPLLVRIDGPYANAPSPTEATPPGERDDRKAFLFLLHHRNGSCAAGLRTEPQKHYLLMQPAPAFLAAGFAVAQGFVLVTPSVTGFKVQTYDVDDGFVDEFHIAYTAPLATAVASFAGAPLSATDADPCKLSTMRTKRYPHT